MLISISKLTIANNKEKDENIRANRASKNFFSKAMAWNFEHIVNKLKPYNTWLGAVVLKLTEMTISEDSEPRIGRADILYSFYKTTESHHVGFIL